MENFHTQHVQLHSKIAAIQHSKYLSEEEKVHQISLLKAVQAQSTDQSSRTVWGVANCMIGSAMIIYPILFAKSGIVISSILMIIISSIQCLTCRLLVIHNRPDQATFNQSILRIGGQKINRLNSIANMLSFFMGSIAIFMLLTHNFYEVTSSLLPYTPPKSNEIVISKYSIQWAAVIVFFAIKLIIFRRQLNSLLKLSKYAFYCVVIYMSFIFLNVMRHIVEGKIHLGEFRLFNTNFSSIAGAFALSFLVHPMVSPILKKSKHLENNTRDLVLGYAMGTGICFYAGFFGALSCAPEVQNIHMYPQHYIAIFDCVSSDNKSTDDRIFFYLSKIIQLLISIQNFSVLSISFFLTRNQFLNLFAKPRQKQVMFEKFTWFYLILAFFIATTGMDVTAVISLNGAVLGFFISYGIPIQIHLRCLYHKFNSTEERKRKSLMESLLNQSVLGQNQHYLELQPEALECNPHESIGKPQDFILYGTILLCGIALAIFKLSTIL